MELPELPEMPNYDIPEFSQDKETNELEEITQAGLENIPKLKEETTSAADVAISAGQVVNVGWSGIANATYPGKDFENDPDRDTFNFSSDINSDLVKDVPMNKMHLLWETKSTREFMHVRKQIMMANYNEGVVNDNTNTLGAFGLYAAMSIADPVSNTLYAGFAGLAKTKRLAEALESASRPTRAASVGTVSAGVEGTSEALIQESGARNFEEVGYASAFGFVLAGGGTWAYDSLKNNYNVTQEAAYNKLTDPKTRPTTETMPRTQEETRELVDIIQGEGVLSPYRNKVAKLMSNWLPERIQNSPTFMAYKRGGAISALAHKFDTMPGLSTKTETEQKLGTADDDIYNFEGKTAMDMKYELAEHQLYLERDRTDAYNMHIDEVKSRGGKPLSKEAFSEEIWKINQEYSNVYNTAKQQKIAEINNDVDKMSELSDELYSKKETEVSKKYESDETYTKLDEEAKQDFIAKEVEEEVNRFMEYEVDLAAREELKGTPVAELDGRYGPAAEHALAASMKYYNSMNEALKKSGMPHSEYFDPQFFSPRIYDTEIIKADMKGAKIAFENAIRNSVEHKQDIINAEAKLEKAKQQDIKVEDANSKKRIAAREQIEAEIQSSEIKLKEAESKRDRMLEILNDPWISPMQKSIALTRSIHFTDGDIANQFPAMFKIDGVIYKRVAHPGQKEVVMSTDPEGNIEVTDMTVEEFNAAKDQGLVEPLSRQDFDNETALESARAGQTTEQIRSKVQKVIDEHPTVQDLMESTSTRIEDVYAAIGAHATENRTLGFEENFAGSQAIVTHELLHNLTREIRMSEKGRAQIAEIQSEIRERKFEIMDELKKDGIDPYSERFAEDPDGPTWEKRIEYMSRPDVDELFSVALSNPEIAKVLNRMTAVNKVTGERVSLLNMLISGLLKALGIDPKKLNHKSILGQIVKTAKSNAKANPPSLKKETAIRTKYRDIETKIREAEYEITTTMKNIEDKEMFKQNIEDNLGDNMGKQHRIIVEEYKAEIEELNAKLDKTVNEQSKLIDESEVVTQDLIKYHEKRIKGVEEAYDKKIAGIKTSLEESIVKQESSVSAARAEIKALETFPRESARGAVDSLSKQTTLSEMGFPDESSHLKKRSLKLDTSDPELQKFMRKNEALNNQVYHYSTTGRIAVQHATGFHKTQEYEDYLNANNMFMKKDERKIAMDLFELTLGTRQIAENANEGWNKAVRNISAFNYVTMGGQFAKYGMSEIGAGIYATGLSYLAELIPAMGTVAKMYKGQQVTKMEMDMISLVEAGEIWTNNTSAKYGDYDYQESTFAGGAEDLLKRASKGVFRWSGLEGISAITKIALPRAFLRRLLTEADNGKGAYDLQRWGLLPEDIARVKTMPFLRNEKGTITDFNFDAWDQDLADKFQTATSRMSRDAILRPDATRVPAWMNDGGANPLVKLSKQFMSFAAMANERLLLRGFSERQAYAATGAIVSGAILATVEIAGEETAISMGMMEEKNRKYDLNTEKGRLALGQIVAFRNSFSGTGQFLMESIIDFNKFNGGERMIGKIGSATTGKVLLGSKAAKEFLWSGKKGTAAQTHFIKGSTPFNNMFGIDSFNRNITKDLYNEAKERRFYQDDGGFEGFDDMELSVGG